VAVRQSPLASNDVAPVSRASPVIFRRRLLPDAEGRGFAGGEVGGRVHAHPGAKDFLCDGLRALFEGSV
jgi:hypothetical protein